jgi:hypothetical protein
VTGKSAFLTAFPCLPSQNCSSHRQMTTHMTSWQAYQQKMSCESDRDFFVPWFFSTASDLPKLICNAIFHALRLSARAVVYVTHSFVFAALRVARRLFLYPAAFL